MKRCTRKNIRALCFSVLMIMFATVSNSILYAAGEPPDLYLSLNPSTFTNGSVDVIYSASSNSRDEVEFLSWTDSLGNTSTTPTWGGGEYGGITITSNRTVTVKVDAGTSTTRTITITNIDKEPPTVSLSQENRYEIHIDASDNVGGSGIAIKKWDYGSRTIEYFSNAGMVFTGDSVDAGGIGTYTVFVRDAVGNATVKTIYLNKDESPDLSLSLSPSGFTNGSVDVIYSASTNSRDSMDGISWTDSLGNSGVQTWGDEEHGGITITSNRTVTVRVWDLGHKDTTKTITISNIDKEPPSLELTQGNSYDINVTANDNADGSGIEITKWANGIQPKAYFTSAGQTFTGSTLSTGERGTYTIYAKDLAGNETVKTIKLVDYQYKYLPNGRIDFVTTPNGKIKFT